MASTPLQLQETELKVLEAIQQFPAGAVPRIIGRLIKASAYEALVVAQRLVQLGLLKSQEVLTERGATDTFLFQIRFD